MDSYVEYHERCRRDWRDFNCDITLTLVSGKEYELNVPMTAANTPMVTASTLSGPLVFKRRTPLEKIGNCSEYRTRTETEEN